MSFFGIKRRWKFGVISTSIAVRWQAAHALDNENTEAEISFAPSIAEGKRIDEFHSRS